MFRWSRLTTVLADDEWLDVAYVRDKTFIRGLGLDFEFELSGGRVVSVRDQGAHVDVERDEMGYVVGFRGRGSSVRFERDGLRRVAETVYRDGLSSRYSYDALGNRRLAEHSLGSSVAYRHDPAGNIVEVEVANADGSSRLQKTRVGEMNQVEQVVYGDGRTVTVTYDGMGRPTEFDVGSDTVEVSYDELGGLEELVSTTTGDTWEAGHAEPPARGSDHRAEVLKGLASIRSQAGHVVLDFDETTFKPVFADPLELGVPGLAEARILLRVASPLLGGDGFTSTTNFEKPSNPVFQPDEYRSTNCCIPCSTYVCTDCTIDGNVGSWSLCYCQSVSFTVYYDPFPYWNNPTTDTIDKIIAEYEDLNRHPIPSRGEFVTEHSSEHFSKYELNGGDYDYFIPGSMTEIAENVRERYNDLIDDDPDTDYGIMISSGYRNPRRNDRIGGKSDSKHQWGRAVDLVPSSRLPPNMTEAEAMKRIEAAAKSGSYSVVNEGDHIHVGD